MAAHHGHILRLLRDAGPLSRAELTRRSALSATTLTHVTARLIRDGVVIERGLVQAGLGRPALALALAQDSRQVAGVHIGAGAAQIALTDLKAEPKAFAHFEFDAAAAEPQALVARVVQIVRDLCTEIQIDARRLTSVGVGFPGPVDESRRGALASINLGFRDGEFASRFEDALGVPCALEHNVTAMALAESRFGVGRNVAALLYVYLRAGLGAGLVIDGVPFRPGGHGAVELGHIQVDRGGPRCACGNTGCLEAFVCERALMDAVEPDAKPGESLLARVMAHGDAYERVVGHLTTGLASAVNLLAPDLIVFGGHLGEAPDELLQRLAADLPPRVMPHLRAHLKFARSRFGWRAGAVGAATVALDAFFYSGALH